MEFKIYGIKKASRKTEAIKHIEIYLKDLIPINNALKNGKKTKVTEQPTKDKRYIPIPAKMLNSSKLTALSTIIGITKGNTTPRGASSTCDSVNE